MWFINIRSGWLIYARIANHTLSHTMCSCPYLIAVIRCLPNRKTQMCMQKLELVFSVCADCSLPVLWEKNILPNANANTNPKTEQFIIVLSHHKLRNLIGELFHFSHTHECMYACISHHRHRK